MFDQLLKGWTTLREGLSEKSFGKSLHGTRLIIDAADDAVNGPPMVGCSPEQAERICDEINKCCAIVGCPPLEVGADPVAKIGDGTLLKKLLELLPLILKFI